MIKDWFRKLLGTATEYEATRPADPEDLIALGRVSVSIETKLGYEPSKEAGVAFADVNTEDFQRSIDEVESVIRRQDGTKDADVERTDSKGTKWIVVNDETVNSLTANLQYAASAMSSVGKSSRLLAAVMPFEKDNQIAYLIYSFNRGKFYPFVPIGTSERDRQEEERIATIIEDEIDVEDDRNYWYPLWSSKPDLYPWQ